MATKRISAPLHEEQVMELKAGDNVLITGVIYTARDAAHKKLVELLAAEQELPLDLQGQIFYYVGPTPPRPEKIIGAAGPTTSGRMDAYTPALLKIGLKGCIGKGSRNRAVKDALKEYKAVYMAAVGGAAALISRSIKKAEIVAYPELGPEAMRRLEVENFPAVVVNDVYGNDLYVVGKQAYARLQKE